MPHEAGAADGAGVVAAAGAVEGCAAEWLRPGGAAVLQGLKAKPELNGQDVEIEAKDASTGRWRCKVAPFGEVIKVRAENLAPAAAAAAVGPGAEWLRRGVHAVVQGHGKLGGQVVRVLSVDLDSGRCECRVRATGEAATVSRAELRPLHTAAAGEAAASGADASAASPAAAAAAAAALRRPAPVLGSTSEERRLLAHGGRAGYEEGATVVVDGLHAMPELNGRPGRLLTFDLNQLRWQVDIEGAGVKALKPVNLVVQAAKRGRSRGEAGQKGGEKVEETRMEGAEDGADEGANQEAEGGSEQKRPRSAD